MAFVVIFFFAFGADAWNIIYRHPSYSSWHKKCTWIRITSDDKQHNTIAIAATAAAVAAADGKNRNIIHTLQSIRSSKQLCQEFSLSLALCFFCAHASLIYDYGFLYSFAISESECQDLREKLFCPFSDKTFRVRALELQGKCENLFHFDRDLCFAMLFALFVRMNIYNLAIERKKNMKLMHTLFNKRNSDDALRVLIISAKRTINSTNLFN